MKICLTGGIACGKSLLSRFLNEFGVETLDADDIVHEIIPAEERKRLATVVFSDPAARRELEARIHPAVKRRISGWFASAADAPRVAVVPLVYEAGWEKEFDFIVCIASKRELQLERMMVMRGYSAAEAEGRLAAQMPIEEKAKRAQYVIFNNGTENELREEAEKFVKYLKEKING